MATLELVSHPICPYVHRTAAFLADQGIPFTQRHVDLQNKPDWLLAISPRGKVPVLVVDGTPIFESAVILQYVAEAFAPSVLPADPLTRARHRMWIEITNDLLVPQYKVMVAATPAEREQAVSAARETLLRFEPLLDGGRFLGGDTPNLVDYAAGPALVRFERLTKLLGIDFYRDLPKVAAWSAAISAHRGFSSTLVADFDTRFAELVKHHDSAA